MDAEADPLDFYRIKSVVLGILNRRPLPGREA